VRVIFFGTPHFAVPSLSALLDSGEEVVSVVTQPDRVKGRGHALSQPPVKEYAISKGIPVLQPSSVRTPSFLDELTGLSPDVIAVVAYGKIIPPSILQLPRLGCVNVHASLLPKYRGAAPVQWAIISGDAKTGVTTMLMDEGLDTGDVLLMEETEITDEDTAHTLGLRLSEMGAALLMRTLRGLKNGSVKPVPQSGEPSYAPPLKKEDGRIDWSLPARKIFNLIRGTYPWPGAYSYLGDERVNVIKAGMAASGADGTEGGVPGRIAMISEDSVNVCTGEGRLALLEVKPEGKKIMPAAAYSRGRRLKEGASFDVK
jgi:methionyl-tRNA formyltransferase